MSGMSGGSMLRTRRKDVNVKPNRRLDRKSSRGMLYENEELRLRTININAEVERGQSDIKKLKRENEQLRREVGALRGEYDRLERLLRDRHQQDNNSDPEESGSCCSDCESDCCNVQNNENDLKVNELCCDKDCGRLTSVPEEPRSPLPQTSEVFSSCPAETTNQPQMDLPIKEYYTAMVSLPFTTQIPESLNLDLDTPTIFPKSGLDILVNDDYQTGNSDILQGYSPPPPPIGFVYPDQSSDNLQIVPNVESPEQTSDVLVPITNTLLLDKSFAENENDLDKCLKSLEQSAKVLSEENLVKDSYFICKTRKVIHQSTTILNTPPSKSEEILCNCGCNTSFTNLSSNQDKNILENDNNIQSNPSYITEKNIELNYDYPKPITCSIQNVANAVNEGEVSQTTKTTTEVNSTVVMIERLKVPEKPKSRWNFFNRSQSVPCNANEPVYATVHKLPQKLRRNNIKNLEIETKYINLNQENTEKKNEDSNENSQEEKSKVTTNSNDSEQSEIKNLSCESNVIPKSATVRKKKRFSIHFKRKNKANKNVEEETKTDSTPQIVEKDSEMTSSPDVPDVSKLITTEPYYSCKRHNGNTNFEDVDHHHHHRHHHHHGHKKRPHRNHDGHGYLSTFKHDSYQEMTTSHSERERTNSLSSSGHSRFSIPSNKVQPAQPNTKEGSIPWCGCWGNGCL